MGNVAKFVETSIFSAEDDAGGRGLTAVFVALDRTSEFMLPLGFNQKEGERPGWEPLFSYYSGELHPSPYSGPIASMTVDQALEFLIFHLSDLSERYGAPISRSLLGTAVAEACLIAPLSPINWVSLKDALNCGGEALLGTFLGVSGAPDASYALLFITIPAGIVIVGAATGVSGALKDGLREVILRHLSGKPPGKGRQAPRRKSD